MKILTGYRKFLIAVLLIFIVATAGFSYDGTIVGGMTGSYNYLVWASELNNNIPVVRNEIRRQWHDEIQIISVSQIRDSNRDAEVNRMIRDLEAYISNNYRIVNENAFSHQFVRSVDGNEVSAWMVLSHYTGIFGYGVWNHIIYFYTVRA